MNQAQHRVQHVLWLLRTAQPGLLQLLAHLAHVVRVEQEDHGVGMGEEPEVDPGENVSRFSPATSRITR